MLKYIFISILTIFMAAGLNGQQISPWVIASAGSDGSNQGYHMSWTLGEVAINTEVQPQAALLQGFQQPNYFFDVLVEEPGDDLKIEFYPNPTSGWVNIEISGTEKLMTVELYDLIGRRLFRKNIEPPLDTLDLSELPGATYFLKVLLDDKNKSVGFWRVQKFW